MGTFEIVTVVVVLAIFSLFYYAALKAEKVVNEKARQLLESQSKVTESQPSGKAKAAPKSNHTQQRIIR